MKARETAVILATGGMGLVRAAYSAGKPAYGVGPGNAPAYIERTADVARPFATSSRARRSTTACLCSSENSVVVDDAAGGGGEARSSRRRRALSCPPRSVDALATVLVTPQRLPKPGARRTPATVYRAAGRIHGSRPAPAC